MASATKRIRGRVSVHPRGFGFLRPEVLESLEGPISIFLAPPDINDLVADDLVEGDLVEAEDGRLSAANLTLVDRSRTRLLGEVIGGQGGKKRLRPDPELANTDWPLDGARRFAVGTQVVAEIEGNRAVRPQVLEGADASLERVIVRWNLRGQPTDELEEAGRRSKAGKRTRRDLRDVPMVTIDGPSTRDLDDAVGVLPPQEDGAVRVLVSIADVDAFAPARTALDEDARQRGTSVYLPGAVLPMFPRSLSEEKASLRQGQDCPALTIEMRIDPEGRVRSVDLDETLIRSDARLTYAQVEDFLDRGKAGSVPKKVRPLLRWLRTAAGRISAVRAGRGGMRMSRSEPIVALDRLGEPVGVSVREETSAHRLIERLMVAANESVASWLSERGLPALYRVHPSPGPDQLESLAEFAEHFGFETAFGQDATPRAFAAFEEQLASSRVAPALRAAVWKTLGPARYTVHPGPHFGLAAPLYLHFTSPIRRYADLINHRIVKAHLRGEREQQAVDPELETLAAELNELAFRAAKAESQRLRMLAARYFGGRIGEEHEGNVVSVESFGLVVQLEGAGVTGTIAADALPGGEYREDPATRAWVSVDGRSGYGVGRSVRVRIAGADEELGRIELELV